MRLKIKKPEIHCLCCGSICWIPRYKLPEFLFDQKAEVFACEECGFGLTFPEPVANVKYYEDDKSTKTHIEKKDLLYTRFAHSLLSMLSSNKTNVAGQDLLDLGCGAGYLVSAAIELGYRARGIEANKIMVDWAVSRGLPVTQGDIQQLTRCEEQFDVIVLSAVLEHVKNPNILLLDCARLLKPGGRILISQASYDGLLPTVFPWGWYGWQPMQHFWHFTPRSLEKFALSCGLNLESYVRNSLHHKLYFSGGLKNIIGRNIATLIARLGELLGRGDSFDCILIRAEE